jgi:anti-sigma factor RsiW
MECSRWVEEGLLYLSGELETEERRMFEEHKAVCSVCEEEVQLYEEEKEAVFRPQWLEVATSPELDERIRIACEKVPRPAVTTNLFGLYVRKAVLATLFLAVGFSGGVYVAMNLELGGNTPVARQGGTVNQMRAVGTTTAAAEPVADASTVAEENGVDSIRNDSSGAKVINRGGEMAREGLVPVDVKER